MLRTAGFAGIELAIAYGHRLGKVGPSAVEAVHSSRCGLADAQSSALRGAAPSRPSQARQARTESLAQGRFLAKMSFTRFAPRSNEKKKKKKKFGMLGMLQLLRDYAPDHQPGFTSENHQQLRNALISVINDIWIYAAHSSSGQCVWNVSQFDLKSCFRDSCSLFNRRWRLTTAGSSYCSLETFRSPEP